MIRIKAMITPEIIASVNGNNIVVLERTDFRRPPDPAQNKALDNAANGIIESSKMRTQSDSEFD